MPNTIKPQKKLRAGRNKTLTLTETERAELARGLATAAQIYGNDGSLRTDIIVNDDVSKALQVLPDGFADLIIIDPPYNLQRSFGSTRFHKTNDEEYENYLRSWLPEVCRKLKSNGALYLCGDWRSSYVMQRVLQEHLTILNRITWQREKGRGAAHNWKNSMEDIWFAVKDPKDYYFNTDAVKQRRRVRAPYREGGKPKDWEQTEEGRYRMTCPSNFWDDITVPFWSMPENTDHPTQKPEKLYAKLILASSREGDVVFDPFLGSGTSAVVARKLNRRFIGVDINKEYCLWALKRLQMADTDKSIQGYEDGVFWERNTFVEASRKSQN